MADPLSIVGVFPSIAFSTTRTVLTKYSQYRSQVEEHGYWVSFFLNTIFSDAAFVMDRVERYALDADDEHVIAFMGSYTSSFNMIGVAGAIMAQVAITAISLPSLENSHWTVEALFIASLVTGSLSVFFSCAISPAFHGLHSADDIKDFLTKLRPSEYTKKFDNLVSKCRRKGLSRLNQDELEEAMEIVEKENWKVASPYAAILLIIPKTLLNVSLNAFLIGLGVYLGELYTAELTPSYGSGSIGILVSYLASVLFGTVIHHAILSLKTLEGASLKDWRKFWDDHKRKGRNQEMGGALNNEQDIGRELNPGRIQQSTHTRHRGRVTYDAIGPNEAVATPTLGSDNVQDILRELIRSQEETLSLQQRLLQAFDTDLYSDADDAAALLIAATSPRANILAVNVNVVSSYSAVAASAILAHYGHSLEKVPLGIRRPLTNQSYFDTWRFELGEYASKVAFHYANTSKGSLAWGGADHAWDAVALYRRVLAEADDSSVTIASIGFLENLSGLLNSTADEISPLNGRDLVASKVSELVIMGGAYPSGYEWNFWGDNPLATAHVINTWQGKMVFSGYEMSENVLSGGRLMKEGPLHDPVHGLNGLFEYANEHGYNYIHPNGSNEWIYDKAVTNQHFLKLSVCNKSAAKTLDDLYLDGAWLAAGTKGLQHQDAPRKSASGDASEYFGGLLIAISGSRNSPWMQRLRALPEAILPRRLVFRFKNTLATAKYIYDAVVDQSQRDFNPVIQSLSIEVFRLLKRTDILAPESGRVLDLAEMLRMLRLRSTSRASDEVVSVVYFLDLDVRPLLVVKGDLEEQPRLSRAVSLTYGTSIIIQYGDSIKRVAPASKGTGKTEFKAIETLPGMRSIQSLKIAAALMHRKEPSAGISEYDYNGGLLVGGHDVWLSSMNNQIDMWSPLDGEIPMF
ncbi:hypothetical protein O1611_g8024 [Lasiodiplodia mahajangana]|uniref:Uncharacterized protein n=1 Tax=Lasiodiplodia mahajangana TaxID=1108764 RepID=A0ACC2JDR7_9PEZI|nr:hypothetical protein O1611_g8024 [Lasiodiplodia mahajangana]